MREVLEELLQSFHPKLNDGNLTARVQRLEGQVELLVQALLEEQGQPVVRKRATPKV